MNTTAQRLLLTFATGSLVGSGFVIAKLLLNAGASQTAMSFVQFVGAAAVLVAALKLRGGRVPMDAMMLRYFVTSALIGVLAVPLLGNWVLARIPTGIFTVLVTLSPMFTTLFNTLLDRRLPAMSTIAGTSLGLLGVALVLVPRAQAVEAEQALALLVSLGVPMLLAVGNVYRSRRWPQGLGAPAASAGTLLMQSALLALLFLGQTHGDVATLAPLWPLWPLLVLLIATTVVANLAGSTLQRVGGAAAYSQIGYVIALTGIAASALLFGESLGALFWPALVLVFAGVVLANRAPAAVAGAASPSLRASAPSFAVAASALRPR